MIQAGHGLLQLGSCKIVSFFPFILAYSIWLYGVTTHCFYCIQIQEDLHFVLRMSKMVESIGYQMVKII